VLYRKELLDTTNPEENRRRIVDEFNEKFANPYIAADAGFIDEVIEPAQTRPKLIRALSLLRTRLTPIRERNTAIFRFRIHFNCRQTDT
jgi:acetyl-CoA carboxylase carboxyltransferase component